MEENIFDDANVSESIGDEETVEDDTIEGEVFKPTLTSESPADRAARKGLKEKADGKILTIKSYGFTSPKTKDFEGNKIDPKLTEATKKPFYQGKLVIRFVEDNLIEYYPNVKYFVNDGKINKNVKLPRSGNNEVAKLVALVVEKSGKNIDSMSDKDLLDFLVGKRVKIKTTSGTYMKKEWFRNDCVAIVD